jgi:hypothetical protein
VSAGLERFEFRGESAREILRSPEVADLILAKCLNVAGVVERHDWPGRDAHWEIVADVQVGPGRVVGIVSGVPMRVEEATRIMGAALGGA